MSTKHELIIEIGSEELPAGEVLKALTSLREQIISGLDEARLSHGEARSYATPRRLTVIVPDVDECQPDLTKEVSGPPKSVAFRDGQWTKAAEGFARGLGLTVEDLTTKETPKGEYLFAVVEEKGQGATALIAPIVVQAMQKIPFKKTMRWGDGEATFVRPIQWMVALFGEHVLDIEYGDVKAGRASRGHRFLAPEAFDVTSGDQYVAELRARHVEPDVATRRAAIVEAATQLAESVGGRLRHDDELFDEVVQLVEKPVPMICRFDDEYLDIPHQVLISEMREHQRYLSVVDEKGALQPYFVVIANTLVSDETVVKDGYRRVLTARFQDGVFFYKEDQKTKLADRYDRLADVQFHRALGSIRDKVERVKGVAGWLADAVGSDCDRTDLERAGRLMKADLLTKMVFEFPELQGEMGRAYATIEGERPDVAAAIEEHYMPRNAGDDLPQGDLGALLGMADRLDTIVGIFSTGKGPTGAADPFGLRRAVLAIINILRDRDWHVSLSGLLAQALERLDDRRTAVGKKTKTREQVEGEVSEFVRARLKGVLTSNDVPTDVAEAALSAGYDDLVDAAARAEAMAALRSTPEFEPIAVAFKRVANILKGQTPGEVARDELTEDAERALFDASAGVGDKVRGFAEARDFAAAIGCIAEVRPTVDAFFEAVMVMAEEDDVRARRVALVGRVHRIFAPFADFTKLN